MTNNFTIIKVIKYKILENIILTTNTTYNNNDNNKYKYIQSNMLLIK